MFALLFRAVPFAAYWFRCMWVGWVCCVWLGWSGSVWFGVRPPIGCGPFGLVWFGLCNCPCWVCLVSFGSVGAARIEMFLARLRLVGVVVDSAWFGLVAFSLDWFRFAGMGLVRLSWASEGGA